MKLSQRYTNEEAFEGNRSSQFFGIELFMEKAFFHKTSTTKFGSPRPDTRIAVFDRKLQESQRSRINAAAERHGLTKMQAKVEWEIIVLQATKAATDFIKSRTDCGRDKNDPLTLENHSDLIKQAFRHAIKTSGGIVEERENFKDSWTIEMTLLFTDDNSNWIYIRHDHPSSDIYKIGVTKRREKRNSAYATHSAESREIATYPEAEHLTEKKIHKHFSKKRVKLEFFRLSSEDVELVSDPVKMAAAIREREN
jgi:hypothetical protein